MKVRKQLKSILKGFLSLTSGTSIIIIFFLFGGCATPSIRVTREQTRGDMLFNGHKYLEASQHYELMLEASRKLGIYRNPEMESDVHHKIANCYEMLGDYELALSHVKSAIEIDSVYNKQAGMITGYRHLGKIYVYMGSNLRGTSSLERSLSLSDGMDQSLKNENKLLIADNYLILGQLYSIMGLSGKALEFSGQALELFSQADDGRGEMESNLTLASVYYDMGDISTSRDLIGKSMMKAIDLNLGTSRHNQLLASIASEAGEFENALSYQERALNEARDFGIMGQVIWTTIGLGDIYSKLGDYNRAERYYREARLLKDTVAMKTESLDASLNMRLGEVLSANNYFLSQGSFTGEALSSMRIAELLMQRELYDSALMYLSRAEESFLIAGNRQGILNVMLGKGRIMIETGDFYSALPLLDTAVKARDFPETMWQAWYQRGRLYEKLSDDEKALESYRNSISVIEKIRGNLTIDEFKSTYFGNKREVYDKLIRILLKMNKPEEAFQISEQARARAFYDILAEKKIDFKGSVPGDLISMEQNRRFEIQQLYRLIQRLETKTGFNELSQNSELKQLRETVGSAVADYDDIIRKIKLHDPAYAEMLTAQPVDPDNLKAGIDEKTAVISFWISDDELIIWFITKSEITSYTVQVSGQELSSLVESARLAIRSNSMDEIISDLSLLFSKLFANVESRLESFNNLVIIPNRSLHFLPFQALIDSKGEYLVQNHNFVYAPSASVFMIYNDRQQKTGSRFMGMALSDVVVDEKNGLPGTEDELREILPLFSQSISAFGNKSTEKFVKENAGDYDFIHFATHGTYNYEQPLYSHLVFLPEEEEDGKLNVFEVFELKLNASLVTLSACETGLGNINEGDEMIGLSRAFLFAGSSAVIVSLWAVADHPTSLLMTNFYRYLKDHSIQEALTMAQRDVVRIYPQPLYWSPFVLIGNGNVKSN